MIKKISAILIAAILSASMLVSCGSSDSSGKTDDVSDPASDSTVSGSDASNTESKADESKAEPAKASLTIDGNVIDTKDLVMCTVDGTDIGFERFRYYFFYMLSVFGNNYGLSAENIAADEEASKAFKENLISLIKGDMATTYLARENNIKLSEQDIQDVDEEIDKIKAQYSTEEDFNAALTSAYLTLDSFKEMQQLTKLYSKVEAIYRSTDEDFKKAVQDKDRYSRVIHVLIPFYCKAEITDESTAGEYDSYNLYQKGQAKQSAFNALSEEDQKKAKEEAKKLAEEVLEKAKSGDEFEKLVTEYGWDPGMEASPDGYYIDKENSKFIKEFVDASFAIGENEVSDIVETDTFGWFIIKRLPVDMDYVEKNLESMHKEFDTPTLSKVFNDAAEKVEFKGGEYFDKLTATSIT